VERWPLILSDVRLSLKPSWRAEIVIYRQPSAGKIAQNSSAQGKSAEKHGWHVERSEPQLGRPQRGSPHDT
jgi:hypothetical protein